MSFARSSRGHISIAIILFASLLFVLQRQAHSLIPSSLSRALNMSVQQAQHLLRIKAIRTAKTSYPTGNPKFSVKQSFPAAFDEEESDPFLMCDFFSETSAGAETDPDRFPVGWHPHRGMDICSYMKAGLGRHADSLGNRETFATPGMQWISVGSGIEHAEAGGTPRGQQQTGFQIWINVPAKHKMDDPQYGTVDPAALPLLERRQGAVQLRVLAGAFADEEGTATGPFRTKQPLQMVDYMLQPNQSITHTVPAELDNCLAYIYEGEGRVNAETVRTFHVVQFETDVNAGAPRELSERKVQFSSSANSPMSVLLFAGKRINEPIAWRGPFVMNTQEQLMQTMLEYQRGAFPPKRVPWDYKRLAAFPKDKQQEIREREETCKQDISLDKTNCL